MASAHNNQESHRTGFVTQLQGKGTTFDPGRHKEDMEPPKKDVEVDSSATSYDDTAGRAQDNTRIKKSQHSSFSETAGETQSLAAILSILMPDIWMNKDMVTYTKHVVNQTVRGLTMKAFCLDTKDVMKIREANTGPSPLCLHKLESVLSEQLSMDAAVIKCLRVHTTEQSVGSANKKKKKKSGWREHVWPVLHIVGICTIWAILATILL